MKKITLLALFICSNLSFSQDLYDLNTIQTIEITFAQSNWDALLDAAEASDAYISAQSVSINGTVFPNVGAKYKGNSSYNASQVKNPWHLELDTYVDQNYQGFTDIKLSNVIFDPSFVREALGYKILGNYMKVPKANFAKVYVNGTYIGLYTNVESISKKFVDSRFGSKTNAFFDCSPPAGAGPQTTNLPNLSYLGTNYTSYESAYEMKSTTGWDDLIGLTNTISTTTSSNTALLEAKLDMDRTLWFLAFHNLFVNLDSYIGQFKQNYYLYKSDNGQFNPIIWDLNMCFGVFGMTGSGSTLTTATKKNLSPTLHLTESAWPLVNKLLAIPTYKKRYLAHYKTMLAEVVATNGNSYFLTDAQAMQTLINAAFTSDVNKFSYQTTANFTNNLNATDVTVAGNSAPGITGLLSARKTYLETLSDFTNSQPVITNVIPSNTSPTIGNAVSIKATVTNTTTSSVYLGYKSNANDIFVKTLMYDDGLHNDGAANDNIYGTSINVTNLSTYYYIYAENTNVGKFSPERAENEFYTITAQTPSVIISNPTPFVLSSGNYSFTEWNATEAAGTYPNNMMFWTHAITDPLVTTEFVENWNCIYGITGRSRVTGEGINGFSFINTGNSQYTGVCDNTDPTQATGNTIVNGRLGAAVLALNTTGTTGITVNWTARTITQNNRVYALRMQYRIGTGNGNANADWQDFTTPVEYTSSTTGHNQTFATILPTTCENQNVVQLRWVYYNISGSGSRSQIALDDVLITTTNLATTNFNNSKFVVFPNPTNSFITLSADAENIEKIELRNLQGQLLFQNKAINKNQYQIDLSSYSNGIYLVIINDNKTFKIIKN
jgi:hypothetical protein